MTKLICFDSANDLVKSFAQDPILVSKSDFATYPERYLDCIAICYGLSNYGEILIAKQHGIKYLYIDNCYFGSLNSFHTNRKPKKIFYRVVLNDLVLHKIINRPPDRFEQQLKYLHDNYGFKNFYQEEPKNNGSNIIIIPPSGKVNQICNINPELWSEEVYQKIKQQTDLNITIKSRPRSRPDRFVNSSIYDFLQDGYAIITFASMAAVEAVSFGVPSFIYNHCLDKYHSAAEPMSVLGIEDINYRYFPQNRKEWLYHLAYGQFSREEMSNGFAKEFMLENLA